MQSVNCQVLKAKFFRIFDILDFKAFELSKVFRFSRFFDLPILVSAAIPSLPLTLIILEINTLDKPVFSIGVSDTAILLKFWRINWSIGTSSITSTIISTVNLYCLKIDTLDELVISSIEMSDATILIEALNNKSIKILNVWYWHQFWPSLGDLNSCIFFCTPCTSSYSLKLWAKYWQNWKAILVLLIKWLSSNIIQKVHQSCFSRLFIKSYSNLHQSYIRIHLPKCSTRLFY